MRQRSEHRFEVVASVCDWKSRLRLKPVEVPGWSRLKSRASAALLRRLALDKKVAVLLVVVLVLDVSLDNFARTIAAATSGVPARPDVAPAELQQLVRRPSLETLHEPADVSCGIATNGCRGLTTRHARAVHRSPCRREGFADPPAPTVLEALA